MLLLVALLSAPADVAATDVEPVAPMGQAVSDTELADLRGGFALPNGMVLDLGIDIRAQVDGRPVYSLSIRATGPDAGNAILTTNSIASTSDANVALRTGDDGTSVLMTMDGLRVQQTVGRATGIVVANTGGDRAIDVETTINAQVGGLAAARYMPMVAALRVVAPATVLR